MRALCKRLFDDESGVILSAEIVMVATVGVLALVAGWNAVSASLAGELADVANAFGSLNQSYNVKSINAVGHARCSGHGYNDSDTLVSVSESL
jgi:Flp pilus assembly pilin Flp